MPASRRHIWVKLFLEHFRDSANVRLACQQSGIERKTAYTYRAQNADFAAAWADAEADACDLLELKAREIATIGVEEEVWYQGEVVGKTRRVDPGMLRFLLAAHRKEVYGRQVIENVGKDGGPQEHFVVHSVDTDLMTTEELEVMLRVAKRIEGKEPDGNS